MKQFFFLSVIVFLASCLNDPFNGRDFSKIATSTVFAAGQKTGEIDGGFVKELSGLAPSHRNPGAYWTHNDGKKVTEIYLVDSLGKHLATCKLHLPNTQDCEDIAVGTDPETGVSYIYLADIGDNHQAFPTHFIYRIPEPKMPSGLLFPQILDAEGLETIAFQYPEGKRYNAETLLLDPKTQHLFVMTKAHGGATFFKLPSLQGAGAPLTLEYLGNFPIDLATAGDVSPDGSEVLIKNKKKIYYWKVPTGKKMADVLLENNPEKVPYHAENQGEAICFNLWGTGFLTSTERANLSHQAIFYYSKN